MRLPRSLREGGSSERRCAMIGLPGIDDCPQCGYDERNCMCDDEDFMDSLDCTHCGGDGICDDGADPLWSCPAEAHCCHACNGSGKRRDQVIF